MPIPALGQQVGGPSQVGDLRSASGTPAGNQRRLAEAGEQNPLAPAVACRPAGIERHGVRRVPVIEVAAYRVELVRGYCEVPARAGEAKRRAVLDRYADVQPLLLEPVERRRVDLGERLGRRGPLGGGAVHNLEVAPVQTSVGAPDEGQQRPVSLGGHGVAVVGGGSASDRRRAYSLVRSWKRYRSSESTDSIMKLAVSWASAAAGIHAAVVEQDGGGPQPGPGQRQQAQSKEQRAERRAEPVEARLRSCAPR